MRLVPNFVRFSLALGCAFGALFAVSAQTATSSSAAAQEADQELNKTYQQVMQKLAPKLRTQLRDAQRAWLVFIERDSAAACAAAVKLGKTNEDCESFKVDGFERRTGELSSLLDREPETVYRWGTKDEREMSKSELEARILRSGWLGNTVRIEMPKSELEALLQRLDGELNVVYQRCLHLLSDEEGARLRDAQRAWLAFRDASKPFGVNVVYVTTSYRIHQLSEFYVGSDFESHVSNQISSEADQTVPDPFERAR